MSDTIVLIHGPWMTPQDGWEAVADHALEWAVAQAATRAVAR